MFTIASESMVPDYKVGDIIISKKVDTNNLNVGDDITYVGEKGELKGLVITHRIVKKKKGITKNTLLQKVLLIKSKIQRFKLVIYMVK